MSEQINIDHLVKTKIVCTLGPASSSEEVLTEMIRGGMDIVRLNFSHGSHEQHRDLFNKVRALSERFHHQISIICDIQGPKIRTGVIEEPFEIHAGDTIDVTPDEIVGNPERIQIVYDSMMEDLDVGDTIFINDGIVKLVVESKGDSFLHCVVEAGGTISSRKGCNIPSGNLSINVVTPKDAEDLKLIAELNPEWVAASFVGTAQDIITVRNYLSEYGNEEIKIIAKIERPIALENLDAIIEETDGIMVARGDLGVEIDTWLVPIWQKTMCQKCNAAGIPVIVATQMLESMTSSSRPTRAEANDVFNAVLDGADAVMLSGETSVGKYPVITVRTMNQIIQEAEKHIPIRDPNAYNSTNQEMTETISHGVYQMTEQFRKLKWNGKIIVITNPPSGYVARMVSKYRPNMDIITITSDLRTARELNLHWGVRTVLSDWLQGISDIEARMHTAIREIHNMGLLNNTDHVILMQRAGKHIGSLCAIFDVEKVVELGHGSI